MHLPNGRWGQVNWPPLLCDGMCEQRQKANNWAAAVWNWLSTYSYDWLNIGVIMTRPVLMDFMHDLRIMLELIILFSFQLFYFFILIKSPYYSHISTDYSQHNTMVEYIIIFRWATLQWMMYKHNSEWNKLYKVSVLYITTLTMPWCSHGVTGLAAHQMTASELKSSSPRRQRIVPSPELQRAEMWVDILSSS